MAPVPPNTTARVWLDYTSQGNEHSLLTRWNAQPQGIIPQVEAFYQDFLDALNSFRLTDWQVTGMRYSVAGTDFSLPYEAEPVLTPGQASPNAASQAFSLNFMGRGATSGSRVMWSVFGVNFTIDTDYRLSIAESTPIALAVAVLQVAANNGLVTVSNDAPIIYQYANQRVNAYWQTESRGS